jgi:hypothetical protein
MRIKSGIKIKWNKIVREDIKKTIKKKIAFKRIRIKYNR